MSVNQSTVTDIENAIEGLLALVETTVAAFTKNAASAAHLSKVAGIANAGIAALATAASTITAAL